jgi:hypothetical protein
MHLQCSKFLEIHQYQPPIIKKANSHSPSHMHYASAEVGVEWKREEMRLLPV